MLQELDAKLVEVNQEYLLRTHHGITLCMKQIYALSHILAVR
jgi:hypothetical protein